MRLPAPLPPALRHGTFTTAQARALGVPPGRLRRADVERIRHGVHRWVPTSPGTAAPRGTPPPADPATTEPEWGSASRAPDRLTPPELRLLLAHTEPLTAADGPRAGGTKDAPDVVVSGITAARLGGYWLPDRLRADRRLHLTRPPGRRVLRTAGVATHRAALSTAQVRWLQMPGPDGGPPSLVPVTSAARTWRDLVPILTNTELVILGDWLALSSGPGRAWNLCAPADLHAVATTPGRRGAVRARQAAALVRDGAHSPPETELRLALLAAGLPEPELQITERDPAAPRRRPASADLGWRGPRVVVQYEGGGHDDPVQVARDTQRDRVFLLRDYLVIRASRSDRARGFTTTVELVRRALAERGGLPGRPAVPGPSVE